MTLGRYVDVGRYSLLVGFLSTVVLATVSSVQRCAAEEPLEPRPSREHAFTPFLEQYCYDCHQGDEAAAGLSLEKLNSEEPLTTQRRRWLHVLNRLRAGDMPPEEGEQPPGVERVKVIDWLDAELNSLDCSQPIPPTRSTLRRLNRVEYANTVRDLTGVRFDVKSIFPRDELGHGFDNNGDVLSLSPLLMEKYLTAAENIADEAISTPESISEPELRFSEGDLRGGGDAQLGRLLMTNGRVRVKTELPQGGHYILRVRAYATQAGDSLAQMQLEADGHALRTFEVAAEERDPQTYVIALDLEPGKHRLAAAFMNDAYHPDAEDQSRRDRNLYIQSMSLVGPLEPGAIGTAPAILTWTPNGSQWNTEDQWRAPTSEQIRRLLSRAFRRPAIDPEVERYTELVAAARRRGDSYLRAMQQTLQAALVSPHFLFRGELPAEEDAAPGSRQITDYQLATRISYFLTSSMPDEQLTQVVAAGKLDEQLDQQVTRLLEGERGDELVKHFGQQWLETRRMEDMERDDAAYPEYDEQLAAAMQQETVLFMRDMLRERRPLTDLLKGEYSFLNARLAEHYDVELPTTSGDEEFVRVHMPERRRGGLLTQGSVLTVSSHVDRTSPVLRGKWILDHLLNDPPPDPPPGVSELTPPAAGEAPKSLRAQLELHREDPNCSVCHVRMDPLGFALEHYDAIGRWRDDDGGLPIDDQAQMPEGEQFSGAAGLRGVLLGDFSRIRRALAAKLLTYALGRGLVYHDECALDEIVAATEANGDTLEAMVKAVVHCSPFQQRY